MEKELFDLMEQKLFMFSRREDLEKIRQETNANFRKMKEEQRELILRGLEEVKGELETLKKEGKVDLEPLLNALHESINKLELNIQSMVLQSLQPIETKIKEEGVSAIQPFFQATESALRAMKEEMVGILLRFEQEITSHFHALREEDKTNRLQLSEMMSVEWARLGGKMETFTNQIQKATEEMAGLQEKIKDGLIEVREELGAMIKFSYADLDKKITSLEARVKALENQVFP